MFLSHLVNLLFVLQCLFHLVGGFENVQKISTGQNRLTLMYGHCVAFMLQKSIKIFVTRELNSGMFCLFSLCNKSVSRSDQAFPSLSQKNSITFSNIRRANVQDASTVKRMMSNGVGGVVFGLNNLYEKHLFQTQTHLNQRLHKKITSL